MKKLLVFVPAILLALLLINSCALKEKTAAGKTGEAAALLTGSSLWDQPSDDSTQAAPADKDNPAEAHIIFTSADNGQSWQNLSKGLPEPALDNNGVSRIDFIAGNDGLWLTAANGLYHHTPNAAGPFWETVTFPDKLSSMVSGKAGIYAYHYGGDKIVYKAKGTDLWMPVFTNLQEKRIYSIFETAGGTIFIGSERGLFKSADGGKSWKKLPIGGGGKIVESNGVLVATSEAGIVRSADDGDNWAVVISERGVGIDVANINGGVAAINYSTAANTRRIRTSYDGGKTWQPIDGGFPGQATINNQMQAIIVSNPAKGSADSSWHPATTAPEVPEYKTSIIQAGENFFCGHTDGIYKTSDKGKTWKLVHCAEKGKMFKLFAYGNVIYAIQVESHC